MAKSRFSKVSRYQFQKPKTSSLLSFSLLVFFMKILWLSKQPGQGMLGADGENYLEALSGLLKDGFLSKEEKLSYWPAGYPILMWPIARLDFGNLAFLVGIFQSLLFAISTFLFSTELSRTSLRIFAWPSLILLSLSPTLSLNSVVIGYEITSAALLLLAITMYLRAIRKDLNSILSSESISAAIALMLSTFMQPRMALLAIGIFLPYAIIRYRGKMIAVFTVLSMLIVSLAPAVLIFRNIQANGYAAVSTNLGNTMNVGAGPFANGGYSNSATGVPCDSIEGNAAQQDSHRIYCVLNWYIDNPAKTVRLFMAKFAFHWSPWFGPIANGTMARNPWISFHPLASSAETKEGFDMVFGSIGKTVSYIWVLTSLFLLGLGFWALRRRGGVSTLLAWMLITPVTLNSLTSMVTIGDHRFRMPTLTLSILLQLFGLYFIFSKKKFRKEVDGAVRLKK